MHLPAERMWNVPALRTTKLISSDTLVEFSLPESLEVNRLC